MRITDTAVQAAAKCYAERVVSINDTFSSLAREMITAALPHLHVGYKVKQLEWDESLTALTEYGFRYTVYQEFGRDADCWAVNTLDGVYRTIETAKAAAQADFERRVRECVVAKPVGVAAVRKEVLEEAALLAETGVYENGRDGFQTSGDKRRAQDIATRIRALSAEPAQGEQWLPIETAPKDGTKIDVWMMPHGYRETDVFWSDIQDAWCRESEYPDEPTPLSVVPYPAFWIPLPAAPTTEAEACE